MSRFAVPPRKRAFSSVALAAILIGPALLWRKVDADAKAESATNFDLTYTMPNGWVKKKHSAQALFLYKDPKTKITMRGAASNIISEENPTPELDRDGLTKQFADVTTKNLGWKVEILDVVPFSGGTYRLIRRETFDRIVVTGIAVRGNTTILITLLGIGKAKEHIDGHIPKFREYLASTRFTKSSMK